MISPALLIKISGITYRRKNAIPQNHQGASNRRQLREKTQTVNNIRSTRKRKYKHDKSKITGKTNKNTNYVGTTQEINDCGF